MCIVLGILILALLAYIVYLYASYYRIEDNQELVVEAPVDDTTTGAAAVLATDTEYSAVTYNIGFGAYLPDYSFFMDGGTAIPFAIRSQTFTVASGVRSRSENPVPPVVKITLSCL